MRTARLICQLGILAACVVHATAFWPSLSSCFIGSCASATQKLQETFRPAFALVEKQMETPRPAPEPLTAEQIKQIEQNNLAAQQFRTEWYQKFFVKERGKFPRKFDKDPDIQTVYRYGDEGTESLEWLNRARKKEWLKWASKLTKDRASDALPRPAYRDPIVVMGLAQLAILDKYLRELELQIKPSSETSGSKELELHADSSSESKGQIDYQMLFNHPMFKDTPSLKHPGGIAIPLHAPHANVEDLRKCKLCQKAIPGILRRFNKATKAYFRIKLVYRRLSSQETTPPAGWEKLTTEQQETFTRLRDERRQLDEKMIVVYKALMARVKRFVEEKDLEKMVTNASTKVNTPTFDPRFPDDMQMGIYAISYLP